MDWYCSYHDWRLDWTRASCRGSSLTATLAFRDSTTGINIMALSQALVRQGRWGCHSYPDKDGNQHIDELHVDEMWWLRLLLSKLCTGCSRNKEFEAGRYDLMVVMKISTLQDMDQDVNIYVLLPSAVQISFFSDVRQQHPSNMIDNRNTSWIHHWWPSVLGIYDHPREFWLLCQPIVLTRASTLTSTFVLYHCRSESTTRSPNERVVCLDNEWQELTYETQLRTGTTSPHRHAQHDRWIEGHSVVNAVWQELTGRLSWQPNERQELTYEIHVRAGNNLVY